jgi:hypothetical protein
MTTTARSGTHAAAVAAGRLGGRPAADRIATQVREQGDEARAAAYAQRTGHRVREAP